MKLEISYTRIRGNDKIEKNPPISYYYGQKEKIVEEHRKTMENVN